MIITAVKVLLAAGVACFVPRVFFWLFPINRYAVLAISFVSGAVLYFAIIKLLKVTEINDLIGMMKKKLRKT